MSSTRSLLFTVIMGIGILGLNSSADAKGKAAKSAPPNDAQIAAIVVAANAVDVEAGKLAASKTKNDEVKKFAEQMVSDHTAINQSAADLCKKLGVTPQPNATSKSLQAGGAKNLKALKKLKGDKFDKAYVDHEVAYHEAVLKTIDDVLIPNARNEELKATIEKVRPTIAAHLEHAKNMQQTLASK